MARLRDLFRNVWGPAPGPQDGYGQTWLADLRSARRFRRIKRLPLAWSAYPGDSAAAFPLLDRFGDEVVGWRRDGTEDWFVIERLWHGWPDPPRYAFLAFAADGRIVTGHDFAEWPAPWQCG